MCNQYESVVGADVDYRFLVESMGQLTLRYRVFPNSTVPIVRVEGDPSDHRVLETVRWGFVPAWARTLPKIRSTNARAETVAANRLFAPAFASRRCLHPCEFYVEWKGERGNKTPYRIGFPDGQLFALAGFWSQALIEGEPYRSSCVITTEANAACAVVHDRMPLILAPEDEARWLDPGTAEDELLALLRPCPSDWLAPTPLEGERSGRKAASAAQAALPFYT